MDIKDIIDIALGEALRMRLSLIRLISYLTLPSARTAKKISAAGTVRIIPVRPIAALPKK